MKSNVRRLIGHVSALAIFAALPMAGPAALAADFLEAPELVETQVEYGTGWYLRGDIGIGYEGTHRETQQSNPLPGTSIQRVEADTTDTVLGVGVAAGYRFSPNFRADLSYSYFAESETSQRNTIVAADPATLPAPCGTGEALRNDTIVPLPIENCITENQTSYFLQSFMATGYYDFSGSFAGFRPFVGAGIGLVRNQYTATFNDVTCTAASDQRCGPTDGGVADFGEAYTQQGSRNNGTAYHGAFSLTAGLSYEVSENLFLDTSYSYMHMFEDPLAGGSNGIQAANIPTDFHMVKVGLRLEIW